MSVTALVAESAGGKDTEARFLCQNMGYKRLVTYTTRPPRPKEKDGRDYHFRNDDEFKKMIDNHEFAEYKAYHPAGGGIWYYGSKITDKEISDDTRYLIILTPAGLKDIRHNLPQQLSDRISSVYIHCPEELRMKRLEHRGDDPAEIKRRLEADRNDFRNVSYLVDDTVEVTESMSVKDVAEKIDSLITRSLERMPRWTVIDDSHEQEYEKADDMTDPEQDIDLSDNR